MSSTNHMLSGVCHIAMNFAFMFQDSDDLSKRQKWGSGQSRSKASATAEVMRESTKANLAAAQAQVKQDRRRQRLEQKKMVAQQQQSKRVRACSGSINSYHAYALMASSRVIGDKFYCKNCIAACN